MGIASNIGNILQPAGTPPGDGADSRLSDESFDPGDHTVEDVKVYVEENPDSAVAILDAEVAGKDRSTLTSWLGEFIDASNAEPEPDGS
jgi:hypothetical protein